MATKTTKTICKGPNWANCVTCIPAELPIYILCLVKVREVYGSDAPLGHRIIHLKDDIVLQRHGSHPQFAFIPADPVPAEGITVQLQVCRVGLLDEVSFLVLNVHYNVHGVIIHPGANHDGDCCAIGLDTERVVMQLYMGIRAAMHAELKRHLVTDIHPVVEALLGGGWSLQHIRII